MVLRVGHDPMTACPFMGSDSFGAAMDLDVAVAFLYPNVLAHILPQAITDTALTYGQRMR